MMRNGIGPLLSWSLLGVLPGCLPASLSQERIRPDPAITIRDVQTIREATPYHVARDVPPVAVVEQEPTEPTPRVTRLASAGPVQPVPMPDPVVPPEPAKPAPPPDPALVEAVRAYLAGDLESARKHLGNSRSATTLGTQEELLGVLARLQERDLEQLPVEEAGRLLACVERLVRAVQARAPLLLAQVCFCRRIKSFGVYDALPVEAAFQAGASGQPGERVCIYAELRNVLSNKSGSWHEVALDGSLEIVDFEGRVVFRTDFPATPDRSRSPRSDCYVGYEFNIPPNLPAGRYVLRVQVRDGGGGTVRSVRKSLDFRVVEPVVFEGR